MSSTDCENDERMRLRQHYEHTVERIPMDERQGGCGARTAGIKRDLPQAIPLGQSEKPLDRRLHEPELAPCDLYHDVRQKRNLRPNCRIRGSELFDVIFPKAEVP